MAPGSRSIVGHWWLPENPDEPQPGTLTIAPDAELSLDLIGGFDLEIKTPTPSGNGYSVSMFEKAPNLVHGITDEGNVTLINCGTRKANSLGLPSHHILYAQRALVGVHIDSEDQQLFSSAHVRIENLLTWLALSPAQLSWAAGEGGSSATMQQPPVLVADGPDFAYEAGLQTTNFFAEYRRGGMDIVGKASAYLHLSSPTPLSYSAFDSATKAAMDLVTLASDQACGIISLFLTIPEGRVVNRASEQYPIVLPANVEVIGRYIHTADADAKAMFLERLPELRDKRYFGTNR